jgi:hypothetical protein
VTTRSLEHARLNCALAARGLATGNGPVRARVGVAFVDFLSQIDPERDLPESLRPRLTEIRHRLTRIQGHTKQGGVAENIAAMPHTEVLRLAEDIFDLHEALLRL